MSDEDLFEADAYTITRLPCDSYSILWTVEDFERFFNSEYSYIESSEFQPNGPGTEKFALTIKKEDADSDFQNFSIALKLIEKAQTQELNFKCRLMLLDKGGRHNQKSSHYSLKLTDESENGQILTTFTIQMTIDESSTYLKENAAATIRCEMRFFADALNYPVTSKTCGYMHYSQLIDDLHRIYETQEFSDGVIEVEGQEFFISRAVLAARSPVFKTMFTCGLSESHTGLLKIDDFGASVIRRLLDYIYTGRMGNIEDIAEDLLAAGHKYCIEGVQTLAQEELLKSIELNSVCELLIRADLYNAEMLKQQCIAFIAQHRSEVVRTEGWKLLTNPLYHNLMVELVETTKELRL